MHIYTKSGDKGETGLLGGRRVSKSDCRIFTIGAVDELNAYIGVLGTQTTTKKTAALLMQIQNELFRIGAQLADPDGKFTKNPIGGKEVAALENYIDALEKKLPPLKNFILPGGTAFSAHAHVARAICRRAERQVVVLQEKTSKEKIPLDQHIIIYLNRLSDLLFMLAREEMFEKGKKETIWKGNL